LFRQPDHPETAGLGPGLDGSLNLTLSSFQLAARSCEEMSLGPKPLTIIPCIPREERGRERERQRDRKTERERENEREREKEREREREREREG
jgi:hypothetical protein